MIVICMSIHSLIHSYSQSIIHPSIDSFIHSYIHSFKCPLVQVVTLFSHYPYITVKIIVIWLLHLIYFHWNNCRLEKQIQLVLNVVYMIARMFFANASPMPFTCWGYTSHKDSQRRRRRCAVCNYCILMTTYGISGRYGAIGNASSRIILLICSANEKWRYIVTPSLISWVHTQNGPFTILFLNKDTILPVQHIPW